MTELPPADLDHQTALDALDGAFAAWHEHAPFRHAIAEASNRMGYAKEDIEAQLLHVAERCRASVMRRVVTAELGTDADLTDAPRTVLVLASGGVPGLVLEGIAAAFAIGATALVRPSRDETVLHHFLTELPTLAPAAARCIEVIDADAATPFDRADAAIVYGSDSTIAYVRDQLPTHASARVAGYGSRQGIAVIAPGAGVDTWWAEHLADDVLTFRQRGCMSPSWLFVVGSEIDTAPMVEAIGRELATARDRHLAPGVDDGGAAERRANDADVLAAIAAGMAPSSTALYAGDARLTVVRVPDVAALAPQVASLGTLLQTAVVVADDSCFRDIEASLHGVGCTRIVEPGQAHLPDPLWPHDGLGRVAPLLGQLARELHT